MKMTDDVLILMTAETSAMFADVDGYVPCRHLVPSYNALLLAARDNHPNDPFLRALTPIEPDSEANALAMKVLFAQLRIALESFQPRSDTALTVR
jgi:hypothetical protein